MAKGTCVIADCGKPEQSLGWCHGHYYRWRRYGDPLTTKRRVCTPEEQIRTHYDVVDECWIWRGTPGTHGYGMISIHGKPTLAHRFSYEFHVGPIPAGLHIDHLCFERRCIRPTHLEPVTQAENIRRTRVLLAAQQARYCRHGHEWAVEAAFRADNGRRFCKACRRDQYARRHQTRPFSLTE